MNKWLEGYNLGFHRAFYIGQMISGEDDFESEFNELYRKLLEEEAQKKKNMDPEVWGKKSGCVRRGNPRA